MLENTSSRSAGSTIVDIGFVNQPSLQSLLERNKLKGIHKPTGTIIPCIHPCLTPSYTSLFHTRYSHLCYLHCFTYVGPFIEQSLLAVQQLVKVDNLNSSCC